MHTDALRNGHDSFRELYLQADLKLLLSHCRKAEGGALLAEAERVAREMVASPRYNWDLTPQAKLLKVLSAQAALGWEGKEAAAQKQRSELCTALIEKVNSTDGYGRDTLFGSRIGLSFERCGYFSDGSGYFGYFGDGSGKDPASGHRMLEGVKVRFLRQQGLLEPLETMQKARVAACKARRGADTTSGEGEGALDCLRAQARLCNLYMSQGKIDEAVAKMCELSAAVDEELGATHKLAKEVLEEIKHLRVMRRHPVGDERIVSTDEWETLLRRRIGTFERHLVAEGSEQELQTTRRGLVQAAVELAELLKDEKCRPSDEWESIAQLAVRNAQAWVDTCHASDAPVETRDRLPRLLADQRLALEMVREATFDTAERRNDFAAATTKVIALISQQLDYYASHAEDFFDTQIRENLEELRRAAQLDLARVQEEMGRTAEARALAEMLIDDHTRSPLVRARAMALLASMHLHHHERQQDPDDGALLRLSRAALLAAEPLLARATTLFIGMLRGEVSFEYYGAHSLEWDELYSVLQHHVNVLGALGRNEESNEVCNKLRELCKLSGDEWDEEWDEDSHGGEEGDGDDKSDEGKHLEAMDEGEVAEDAG